MDDRDLQGSRLVENKRVTDAQLQMALERQLISVGRVLPGNIYLPHALIVGGEIITVFDKSVHEPVSPGEDSQEHDQRWMYVKRPTIMAGGELTMRTLDLDFNPITKFYEGPLQTKAGLERGKDLCSLQQPLYYIARPAKIRIADHKAERSNQ